MKNYQLTIEQVSQSRPRYFAVLIDGKRIGETSCLKPQFGADYGHNEFINNVYENAYQMARRVIIHSFNDDVDVFTKGEARIVLPENIAWAQSRVS